MRETTQAVPTRLVHVVGTGLLAERIAAALNERDADVRSANELAEHEPIADAIVVTASDGWTLDGYPAVRRACAAAGARWLPVRAELGQIVLGPSELPGTPGCVNCAEVRRWLARPDQVGYETVRQRHAATLAARPSSWLTGLAAELTATLVADEVCAPDGGSGPARTRNALVCLDLDTLEIATHPFLPDPSCQLCGDLPTDSAALAELTLQPRPKPEPDTLRTRNIADRWERVERTYVDSECGLVQPVKYGSEGGLVTAYTMTGGRDGSPEFGFGRTPSYRDSRQVAILETLERYGGTRPGGKRTVLHASYAEVAQHAIDPRTLGLYPAERIAEGIPYQGFTEDARCAWVWGYSFARSEPVLVPEAYAYYRVRHLDPENPPFAYECSNGSALGNCLEEAVLHGILEVVERDAFLMTWYARLPAARIDLESAQDRTIPLLAEMIRAELGYEIHAFDITMEHRIPTVWVMAVDPEDDNVRPKVLSAAGSHLRAERALVRALSELGPMLATFNNLYPDQRERVRAMVDNPSLVRTMEEHHHLYGNPDVFSRLDFLTGSETVRQVSEMPEVAPSRDLTTDVRELAGRHLDEGMDLIVVDQTTPEHRECGLSCAKAIIPGMLPMTFGYDFRRVDGLPRLYEVPYRLGYVDRPLRASDINPHPHPFP